MEEIDPQELVLIKSSFWAIYVIFIICAWF
jgi:hypothetical protein